MKQTRKRVHVYGRHYQGGKRLTFWKWYCVYEDKNKRCYIRRDNSWQDITDNKEIMQTMEDKSFHLGVG